MPRRPRRKRKRRKYNPHRGNIITKTVMPDSLLMSHRYVETISLTPSVVAVKNLFAANGLYDPNITGVGHQPLGTDQMAPFYDHYTVVGSKISLRTTTIGTEAGASIALGCFLSDGSTPVITYDTVAEQGKGKYIIAASGGEASKKLSLGFSPKRFFGVKDISADHRLKGVVDTSNPSELAYFCVWAQSMTGGATSAFNVIVQIDYTVKYTERKSLAQS